jgi:thiamine transport system substrate-binding protein
VFYASPAKSDTDVGVVTDGCFEQIEFAGVLSGTKHAAAAHQLVDFLASEAFQADMPLNMFVYPARTGTPLPDVFSKYAVKPTDTLTIDPAEVAAKRDTWIKDWTSSVTG